MTFDGPNKLIILAATSLDLAGLWSAWKDWLLAGNAGYALALETVGGEPIDPTAGTLVPLYLFIRNGWKIRPMESDHTLVVSGGTLVVSGGGDPFVSTIGDFTVRIRYQQPVQAIGYSTTGGGSGPSAEDIAAAVWQKALEGALTAEQMQRLVLSALMGKTAGVGTSNEQYLAQDGTKVRVSATFDANSNRSTVVLDGSA